MIVRVLTDKRIFTSEPFKIPWQSDDLPPKFQYLIENWLWSKTLSPAKWHGKHTYLPSLGILCKKRSYFPKR